MHSWWGMDLTGQAPTGTARAVEAQMNRIILTCTACLIMASAFNVRAYAQLSSPCKPTVQPPSPGPLPGTLRVQPPSPGTLPGKPPSTSPLTVLYRFCQETDGNNPRGSLVFHPPTGRLYGLAGE